MLHTSRDGSHTLFSERFGEHYHSQHGAVQESAHVFISAGFDVMAPRSQALNILEMGFGTGLNCFLTYVRNKERQTGTVFYESLEAFPLDEKITDTLNYHTLFGGKYAGVFHELHKTPWNKPFELDKDFILYKRTEMLEQTGFDKQFDLVYFDAFSPHSQPELWTEEIFRKIFESMNAGGLLVTYCAKGSVKRNLKAAGFVIEALPGPPGKREMTRALKPGV